MAQPFQIVTDPESRPRPRIFGGAGLGIHAGQIDDWLDENSKTRGAAWYGEPGVLGWGQKMLADSHVRRARDALCGPVLGADWDFDPGADDELSREVADFCRFVFFECNHWDLFLGTAMRGYIRDGFAVFEETDDARPIPAKRFARHRTPGMGVVVTGLHYRPAWTIDGWGQSTRDPTKLSYVDQRLQGSDGERETFLRVFASNLVRFTWEQEGANFAGFPILRSAWGPWFVKRLLMRIEAMSHERNHLAQPIITLPDDTGVDTAETPEEEVSKLVKMFANFRAHEKGAFVLPGGYDIDFKSGSANTPIQLTIDRLNFDIAHNVAAGFMLLGSKGTAGSYALAQSQNGQFDIALNAHARFIEGVFNVGSDGWSIVERIVRLNYGADVEMPRLRARNMPTVDYSRVLPQLIQAKAAGLVQGDEALETWIRRVTHAPAIDHRTRRETPPAPVAFAAPPVDDEEPTEPDTDQDGEEGQDGP